MRTRIGARQVQAGSGRAPADVRQHTGFVGESVDENLADGCHRIAGGRDRGERTVAIVGDEAADRLSPCSATHSASTYV